MTQFLETMRHEIRRVSPRRLSGRIEAIQGMTIEAKGLDGFLSVGQLCSIERRNNARPLLCETVGQQGETALLMPFGRTEGVGVGDRVFVHEADPVVYPDLSWLGRVVDAFGRSIDDKGALPVGDQAFPIHALPPPAHRRRRLGGKLSLGVRAIDGFASCCRGQRLGIFSGSGVGKSILLSMMVRFSSADVIVVGLIGERGREVREFLDDHLPSDGRAKSVVVVATSDAPALTRRQAAYTTLAIAEYFRSEGKDVLCLMDSVTRFAMAIREISLAAGDPPASKGYTPTVFAELPKLLERAGPGVQGKNEFGREDGNITALFSVLVEGDDHNEPISDALRGILDGHIVLSRRIAHRQRFPAIDILQSVSRSLPYCNTERENAIIERARKLYAVYEDMEELIKLGTYKPGSDPDIDQAITYYEPIEQFLAQKPDEQSATEDLYRRLEQLMDMDSSTETGDTEQTDTAETAELNAQPAGEHPSAETALAVDSDTAVPESTLSESVPPPEDTDQDAPLSSGDQHHDR